MDQSKTKFIRQSLIFMVNESIYVVWIKKILRNDVNKSNIVEHIEGNIIAGEWTKVIYSNKSLSGNPSAENPLSFGTLCIETRLTECMFGEVAQQNVHIISPN